MSTAAPSARAAPVPKAERDRFVAFAFAAADLLLEVDRSGGIGFAAGAAESLTGHAPGELIGRSVFDLVAASDRLMLRVIFGAIERGGRVVPTAIRLAHDDDTAVVVGGCRLPDERDNYHLTFSAPVAPLRFGRDEEGRDPETGLMEKDAFARFASDKIVADPESPLKLTVLRLDGLEALRARVDREIVQGFLTAVGRQIRSRSDSGDAAGRLDGNHFGLIHGGRVDADAVSREIAGLSASIDPAGGGLSVGATTLDLDRSGVSDADAIRALVFAINAYARSSDTPPSIASLKDGLAQILTETAPRMRDLRALFGSVTLAFQPVVCLRTRQLHHYEALARFAGHQSPAGIIAFAEQVGVVSDLDLAICHKAIEVLDTQGRAGDTSAVAVNLSGRSLESAAFARDLWALLRPREDLAERLLFEITESALITQLAEVGRIVDALREAGFRVCLDDFGAGAASFHYLNAFAVDFVKIDGRYVRNAASQPRDRAFLRAMTELCRGLGTAAIAEMVETETQLAQVEALGIEFGQGYLFGKPIPTLMPPARSVPRANLRRRGAVESWG